MYAYKISDFSTFFRSTKFSFKLLGQIFSNLIQQTLTSKIPDNQLFKEIQSKSVQDLGAEPPVKDVGGYAPHESGDFVEGGAL